MASKVPHDPDEVLAVVDEKDAVIGSASRKEVHDKGLLHREVYVFLINGLGQVLLQKRKDVPIWDASCSGHFPKDQDYLEAAQREFEEELGISLSKSDFAESGHFFYDFGKESLIPVQGVFGKINRRFLKVFVVRKDIPLSKIRFDKGEIAQVKFFDKAGLKALVGSPEKALTYGTKKAIEDMFL